MSEPRIQRAEVVHLANLALELSDEEVVRFGADLERILEYVRKLDELDTKNVPATTHAVELPSRTRPDEVRPGLPVERGLQNAPERIGDGFAVPRVIE